MLKYGTTSSRSVLIACESCYSAMFSFVINRSYAGRKFVNNFRENCREQSVELRNIFAALLLWFGGTNKSL